MKKNFRNFSLMASVCLMSFGVASCSTTFEIPNMTLSFSNIEMDAGETLQIKISIDKKYQNAPAHWFTTNENVAYFRNPEVGYVTAVGEGTATVTAAVAGAFASCKITVKSDGGDPEAARFILQTSVSVKIGQSSKLTYSVNPVGSTITFTSSDDQVVGVSTDGTVTGISKGNAVITAVCNNGITRTCNVEVTEEGSVDPTDLDIGVPTDLRRSGEIVIGTPEISENTVKYLCAKFNKLTNSNVTFTYKPFEDSKGVSNFSPKAENGPDVFPFVSDQVMNLSNIGALAPVYEPDISVFRSTMLAGSIDAATWRDTVYGYPFAADNGVVMFYDKRIVTDAEVSKLDTLPELLKLATDKSKLLSYDLTNGFYGGAALHTYSGGKSLFSLKYKNGKAVSSSTFNSAAGLKGLKLTYDIMNHPRWTSKIDVPGNSNIMATIVDTSKAADYKKMLGDNFGVAPTPYVTTEKTERISTYLGYKFYGVNNSIQDATKKQTAHYLSKFLISEYAQNYRFEQDRTQPTLSSLQTICADEPHVKALNQEKSAGGTMLLSIFGDEYFNNTGLYVTKLLNDYIAEDIDPTDDDLTTILDDLDGSWK